MDLKKYAENQEDAIARADMFENSDPFKSVPQALLSSAEIDDYARVTGMLHPFSKSQLKSASYEVFIGGDVIWWDGNGVKNKKTVHKGDPLTLPANSIVFAQVDPVFLLPNYIAIRFNLRISHVQRGLLLGTGPLVDPGFRGKLLIPLHNLTSSDYDINTNDALIWIEFTKTSFGVSPTETLAARPRKFIGFPVNKRWLEPEDYLRKANGPNPIRSSIPDAIRHAEASAANAQASAAASEATVQRLLRRITSLGLVGGAITIVGLGIGLYQIGQQVGQMVQNAQALVATVQQTIGPDMKSNAEKVVQYQSAVDKLSTKLDALSGEIDQLKTNAEKMAQNKTAIDRLSTRLDALNAETEQLKKGVPRAGSPR